MKRACLCVLLLMSSCMIPVPGTCVEDGVDPPCEVPTIVDIVPNTIPLTGGPILIRGKMADQVTVEFVLPSRTSPVTLPACNPGYVCTINSTDRVAVAVTAPVSPTEGTAQVRINNALGGKSNQISLTYKK